MSFVLVLAAAITLVIGLLNTGLGLIYASIACSVVAGVVLALAVVRSRPQVQLATGGPAPLGAASMAEPAVTVLPRSAPTAPPSGAPTAVVDEVRPDEVEEELDVAPVGGGWSVADLESPGAAHLAEMAGEMEFPIADYDQLTVGEIVPLLSELDPDELDVVADRERDGRDRSSIMNRIAALKGEPEPAPAPPRTPARKAPARKAPAKKAAAARAPAKKAPASKAAATRAPAKKSPAKKAAPPAKKAAPPAKKAATAKKAAPVKKAAPAKKAPAKKAPAKKAAAPVKKTAKKAAKRR